MVDIRNSQNQEASMEKKSRLLQIKQYLEERTDEAHPAAITDILSYLENEGVQADRRTVSRDIDRLMESGVDIVCNAGRRNEYFCGSKGFELPELKLLVDAVQASRFISHKKSQALIEKLLSLGSDHQAIELNRHLYSDKQIKSENERVYITVDLLYTAINRQRQVQFKYYEYLPDKRKTYKHNGQTYEFSPYGLIWNGDHYYTVGYSRHHDRVITFRVDRIASPRLTDKLAKLEPDSFDMTFYARQVFQMYDGSVCEVTLLCKNHHMKTLIDRFGENVNTEITGNEHFTATVNVAISPTFYGWVFANRMKILKPEDAVKEFEALKTM